MGAWGTGAFENDAALDLMGDIVEGRFSFEDLVRAAEGEYLEDSACTAVLALVELFLAGRGLREMPVTEGLTVEMVPQVVSDGQARWLLEQMPRALGPDSEEYELWADAGPEELDEWMGHGNAAVADLSRVLASG